MLKPKRHVKEHYGLIGVSLHLNIFFNEDSPKPSICAEFVNSINTFVQRLGKKPEAEPPPSIISGSQLHQVRILPLAVWTLGELLQACSDVPWHAHPALTLGGVDEDRVQERQPAGRRGKTRNDCGTALTFAEQPL